ncbi:type II secretion system F family protein [Patescibacteria group bacterium]|nr:type II secretion system F family protein [Patescibacteria group bacterium]
MKFKYKARNKTGGLQTGFVEGVNREAAYNILTGNDLYILSLESAVISHWYDPLVSFFKKVGKKDVMVFTRQFAVLLSAKISLGDSLKNVQKQTSNLILREVVEEISSDVDSGLSLSQSLERHGEIFSNFFISMIRSAEITGRVDEVVNYLADYLEKEHAFTSKIKNALTYPIIVFVLLFVVGGIMIGFVFPQLKPIFDEASMDLPFFTKIFLIAGDIIVKWWLILIIFLGMIIISVVNYFKSAEGKVVFDEIIVKLPLFGNLFKKIYIARFAESTSVLIKGGVPVAQALEITSRTVGSIVYRDIISDLASAVRQGVLLSNALEQNSTYFPSLISQMVAVGESTGQLDELLSRAGSFYTREAEEVIDNLVELIQPALMIVIGVAVGILFSAVLLPIYGLVQVF